jgi:large subunit ribosomal protein L3
MTDKTVHSGSLQFWPRSRAHRVLPNVNWNAVLSLKKDKGLAGFIGYKVSMSSAYVKDDTPNSMTKGKRIIVPVTIIECPKMKIYSIRLYKNKKVMKDVIVGFSDELKRKLKKPAKIGNFDDIEKVKNDFDDLRIIAYSNVKSTGIKKSPDLIEIALSGTREDKMHFVKEKIGRDISVSEVLKNELVDVRGVTTGRGLQGPVKRFGITLKSHKSEKGVRRPGSLAPWHPARVTFRTPMAGQVGFFTRIIFNNMILKIGSNAEADKINKEGGYNKYGKINTDYVLVKGSVMGPKKRQLLMTPSIRPNKSSIKQKYEVIELR